MEPTTTRRGRGKAKKTLALVEKAIEIADEIKPASVRAICYRLFVAGYIDSMSKSNTDSVSKQLVWAREQGMLPWEWVVDETREAEVVPTWSDPESIIKVAVNTYRKNYWQDQRIRIEVWSEKATINGTLRPVLDRYGVTFRVMHGYGSATALYNIAQETADNDKPLVVAYVGDWDPSGLHMSEVDLPARLERYGGEVTMERIALRGDDVETGTALPHFEVETKAKDPRYQWFLRRYGHRCWELDAMSPVTLRQRVEKFIVDLMDVDAWNHSLLIEMAERESMSNILGTWQSISRQASKYSGDAR